MTIISPTGNHKSKENEAIFIQIPMTAENMESLINTKSPSKHIKICSELFNYEKFSNIFPCLHFLCGFVFLILLFAIIFTGGIPCVPGYDNFCRDTLENGTVINIDVETDYVNGNLCHYYFYEFVYAKNKKCFYVDHNACHNKRVNDWNILPPPEYHYGQSLIIHIEKNSELDSSERNYGPCEPYHFDTKTKVRLITVLIFCAVDIFLLALYIIAFIITFFCF